MLLCYVGPAAAPTAATAPVIPQSALLALPDHLNLLALQRHAPLCSPHQPLAHTCSQEAPTELATALPQLKELDLTANLIHTWSFVVELCSALPQLSVLNLTGNHLHLQHLPCQPPLLTTLRGLVLNECGVTWQQVRGSGQPAGSHSSDWLAVSCPVPPCRRAFPSSATWHLVLVCWK